MSNPGSQNLSNISFTGIIFALPVNLMLLLQGVSIFFIGLFGFCRPKPNLSRFNEIFRLQSPMIATYTRVTDGRSVEGFTGYPLIRHLSYFNIGDRTGAIFKDIDPADLPSGQYHYVILVSGDVLFGKDDGHAFIGTHPFELAQDQEVLAAGQYENGKFNLHSNFVENYDGHFKGFKDNLAQATSAFFNSYSRTPIQYVDREFFSRRRVLSRRAIRRYCGHAEFYAIHHKTLCAGRPVPCGAALSPPNDSEL